MKNIILVGMMGSGKSTIGKLVADKLNYKLIDMDQMIEQMQGMAISQIFDLHGEAKFRALETDLLNKLSGIDNAVISTGGGIVLNPVNTMLLKNMGTIFYLEGTLEQLMRNLEGETDHRPVLKSNSLETVLRVRSGLYTATAHHIIAINNQTKEMIAERIIAVFQQDS
ncbi:shikimate kinase [Fusibacter bizertensis]